MVDELIQEEKLNRCHGCAIQHPSQRQHSCVMMDKEDSWLYYREDVVEKIDLNAVLKNAESVCNALGFKGCFHLGSMLTTDWFNCVCSYL